MLKIAAYCRVSTDKEDQANSFESQKQYFRNYINRQPDWELFTIYADEGITGTSTKKRTAFNRMINDAKLGCFDRIITKEVSRFSRNILDTISFTRELKNIGVGVLFMNDAINTLDPDAELRLSIMGSIAQEESRKTSSRVKWGQTRRMEQGVVFGRSLLGYDVKEGKISINPSGAEIVKLIFSKYVAERKGTSIIARELREAGYRTLTGNAKWTNTSILKILRNEKYCGDLCQKKTYTPDYLTHDKKYNHGEEKKIFIRDHHEPIINRELWNDAQLEIKRRDVSSSVKKGHGNRYPLSGKIKCANCGSSFSARYKTRKSGNQSKTWRCQTATAYGKKKIDSAGNEVGCDIGRQLRDEVAMDMIKQCADGLLFDRKAIINNITKLVMGSVSNNERDGQITIANLEKQLATTTDKKKRVLDAFFAENITKDEMCIMNEQYNNQINELTEKINIAQKRQKPFCDKADVEKEVKEKVTNIIMGQTESDLYYGNLLDHMTVYSDNVVEVSLYLLPTKWQYLVESISSSNKSE